MEYVITKSYDNKIVRVKKGDLEEYQRNQELIKNYLKEGKNLEEIKVLLDNHD